MLGGADADAGAGVSDHLFSLMIASSSSGVKSFIILNCFRISSAVFPMETNMCVIIYCAKRITFDHASYFRAS